MSTESGIPDFRSATGLYLPGYASQIDPEEILSHHFFVQDPQTFYRFYRDHLIYPEAQPNPAHHYLAQLEQAGKLSAIITQNIDSLHEQAGSQSVLKLHGSIDQNHCQLCGHYCDLNEFLAAFNEEGLPLCPVCGGLLKPDVTLYEEALDSEVLTAAIRRIQEADLLIVAGTSLQVYPAARLLQYYRGNHLVMINRDPLPQDQWADLVIHAAIGEVFTDLQALD